MNANGRSKQGRPGTEANEGGGGCIIINVNKRHYPWGYKYVVMVKSDNSDGPNSSNLKPGSHQPYG